MTGCIENWIARTAQEDRDKPTITTTSELPSVIPPLPKGDTKDLKVWKEYWKQHDAYTRKHERDKTLETVLDIIHEETETDGTHEGWILGESLKWEIDTLRSSKQGAPMTSQNNSSPQ